jgi:hypothetical protein
MKTLFLAYVVLEIPELIRSTVYELRRRLRYRSSDFPVEITLGLVEWVQFGQGILYKR